MSTFLKLFIGLISPALYWTSEIRWNLIARSAIFPSGSYNEVNLNFTPPVRALVNYVSFHFGRFIEAFVWIQFRVVSLKIERFYIALDDLWLCFIYLFVGNIKYGGWDYSLFFLYYCFEDRRGQVVTPSLPDFDSQTVYVEVFYIVSNLVWVVVLLSLFLISIWQVH